MTTVAPHPRLVDILRAGDDAPLPLLRDAHEWEALAASAERQALAPLLYRRLRRVGVKGSVPADVIDRLERAAAGVAARSLWLAHELGAILRAAAERGIRCVPLRGLALAEQLYGDITVRPMGDLDLLVRYQDLSRVATLLADLGFEEMDRRPGFARAFSYTLKLVKGTHGGIVVEPHWSIAYPPFVDAIGMDGVWARCTPGRVVGVETLLLGRPDLLLNLCLHLAHKAPDTPLLWHWELDRLIRRDGEALDWAALVARVRQGGLQSLVGEVLDDGCTRFATPIPEGVRDALAAAPARARQRRVERLLAGASGVDGKESLAVLFTLPGVRARLRYALALLFPSPRFMALQYGLTRPRQLGLAYLRRVGHLSWEGVKGTARFLS
jgi:hypothetical protein